MVAPPTLNRVIIGKLFSTEQFIFPVNPEAIHVSSRRNVHLVEIVGWRQIARLGNLACERLSFSGLLPAAYDASYCNYTGVENPWTSVRKIKDWMSLIVPVFVTISGTGVADWFIVETFNTEERPGEPGDVYYSIELTQWIPVSVTSHSIGDFPVADRPDPRGDAQQAEGGTYTIVSGDTLWDIAKREYGDGSLWPRIYDASPGLSSGDPNLIYPGEVVTIPPL